MDDRPWLKYYDKGVPTTIDYPSVTLFELVEESARKYPENPCTIFKGEKISYKEMNALTDRLAAGLVDLGVKKGDRVGIFMPNSPQFVIDYFAILKAGGVVVATNPLYSAREIEHQANDAGFEIMLVMSNYYKTIKAAQPKTQIRTIVVTNIKETLPPVLAFLFGLTKEKKGGFRVTLAQGDLWMKDLIARHKAEDRPKVQDGPDDVALFQYSGGDAKASAA